ncbi:hypothetical protein DFH11DRAFT_85737 [Phellopilus nigrolimitatus]|nr:hypothetical protein DFH11DRAFT_85737 [Phellopilus nigrolimitatus]
MTGRIDAENADTQSQPDSVVQEREQYLKRSLEQKPISVKLSRSNESIGMNGTDEITRAAKRDADPAPVHLLYDLPSASVEEISIVSSFSDSFPPPGNALHLHVSAATPADDMSPSSFSPSSYFPPPRTGTSTRRSSLSDSLYLPEPGPSAPHVLATSPTNDGGVPTPFRVRFRSRVRIASGLRHSKQPGQCSADSSPSSSISAPLRYNPEESDAEPVVSPQTAGPYPSARRKKPRLSNGGGPPSALMNGNNANERTPLIQAPGPRLGARKRRLYGLADDDDARRARRRARLGQKQDEEAVFGKWPWRLLNGYWWVWKCEPVVCCCCPADDSDSEPE